MNNKEIQSLFREGNLIARGLIYPNNNQTSRMDALDQEIQHLINTRTDGVNSNITRDGQRNRSATLLVPNVVMDLFANVGLLYDSDKSTIRAYMFHDSGTVSGTLHDNFYNVNIDKSRFEPILSKQEFLDKYKLYRASTDGTEHEHTQYNEILVNVYPESLVGIVAKSATLENKLLLLEARQFLYHKHQIDLPMVFMNKGMVETWNPSLYEISMLLKYGQKDILYDHKGDIDQEKLLRKHYAKFGFTVVGKNTDGHDTTIVPLRRDEYTVQEILESIASITGLPKGGKFTYGLTGRLKKVVNRRLNIEEEKQVKNVGCCIIKKQDITNLLYDVRQEVMNNKSGNELFAKSDAAYISDILTERVIARRNYHTDQDNNIQHMHNIESKLNQIRCTLSKPLLILREFFYKIFNYLEQDRNALPNKHAIDEDTPQTSKKLKNNNLSAVERLNVSGARSKSPQLRTSGLAR